MYTVTQTTIKEKRVRYLVGQSNIEIRFTSIYLQVGDGFQLRVLRQLGIPLRNHHSFLKR